jgi:hypothetical protein
MQDANDLRKANLITTFNSFDIDFPFNSRNDAKWFQQIDDAFTKKAGVSDPLDVLMLLMMLLVRLNIIHHRPERFIKDMGEAKETELYQVLNESCPFKDDPEHPQSPSHYLTPDVSVRFQTCIYVNRAIRCLESAIWLLDRPDYPGLPVKLLALMVLQNPASYFVNYVRVFVKAGLLTRKADRVLPK